MLFHFLTGSVSEVRLFLLGIGDIEKKKKENESVLIWNILRRVQADYFQKEENAAYCVNDDIICRTGIRTAVQTFNLVP